MDLTGLAKDTAENVARLVKYVLSLGISPREKCEVIKKILLDVGAPFTKKAYSDAAFLLGVEKTLSSVEIDGISEEKFAVELVRTGAIGRDVVPLLAAHFKNLQGEQCAEAFKNAQSLDMHPTLTRYCVGANSCDWCVAHEVAGLTYPNNQYFARHDNCDCVIVVSGYRSRNGVVKNYNKGG